MEELKRIISLALKKGASDIHLVSGAVPYIRIDGALYPVKKPKITNAVLLKFATSILSKRQIDVMAGTGDIDAGVVVDGVMLRVNVHEQTNGLGMSFRVIPSKIPAPEEIGLSTVVEMLEDINDGIVIISGPSGCGKSTAVASIIETINQKKQQHIVTLEDPIEFRFENKACLIEQRELGKDFFNFPDGLRHALRQDPNVIMVGEMRDPDTIELALTAAETGHLVFSTLHSPNATEVVERIVNVFDGARQQQALVQLSATLRLAVAQKLLPRKDGGRIAAREILVTTSAVSNAIRQNNLSTIRSAIQTGRKLGMVSMEQAIKALQSSGEIE